MKIEILCTGDEILSGKTINTNYSHMARRLNETGFSVYWGTVVGDDRQSLQNAIAQAADRADAVIVNGGLGPTVDDLSQEVAAVAAGVELELHQEWLDRISAWYRSRGRTMPDNNTKQAMLPQGAEFIDNPIGTACGFAINIDSARFFFTPGVPVELRRMLEDQILPRLQKMRGYEVVTRVKRFHTFGIGESRADQMLDGVEDIVPGNTVKLGFQSHYPQLETKLTVSGSDVESLTELLAPVEEAVRYRLENFILCEDDELVEDRVIDCLVRSSSDLSIVETWTGGRIAGRLVNSADHPKRIKRGITVSDEGELSKLIGSNSSYSFCETFATECADSIRDQAGSKYGLAVLVDRSGLAAESGSSASVIYALSSEDGGVVRKTILPGRENWIIKGATEMGLDFLRRFFLGLDVQELIDFEQH